MFKIPNGHVNSNLHHLFGAKILRPINVPETPEGTPTIANAKSL